jgi:hypothetical protein
MKCALLVLAACTSEPAPLPASAAGHYTFMFSNCGGDDATGPTTGSMQLLASGPQTYTGVASAPATLACSAEMTELRATLDGSDIELEFVDADGSIGRMVVGTFSDGALEGTGTIAFNVPPYNRFLFSATRIGGPDQSADR